MLPLLWRNAEEEEGNRVSSITFCPSLFIKCSTSTSCLLNNWGLYVTVLINNRVMYTLYVVKFPKLTRGSPKWPLNPVCCRSQSSEGWWVVWSIWPTPTGQAGAAQGHLGSAVQGGHKRQRKGSGHSVSEGLHHAFSCLQLEGQFRHFWFVSGSVNRQFPMGGVNRGSNWKTYGANAIERLTYDASISDNWALCHESFFSMGGVNKGSNWRVTRLL